MSEQRLRGSAFPDDTGEPDADLVAALGAYAAGPDVPGAYGRAVLATAAARLLVPVVAVLGEAEVDDAGLAREKSSDMAVALLRGAGGRLALLAFTGTASLSAWDPDARPVPVTARTAALAALQEGADAVVLDVAGPTTLVVEGDALSVLTARP